MQLPRRFLSRKNVSKDLLELVQPSPEEVEYGESLRRPLQKLRESPPWGTIAKYRRQLGCSPLICDGDGNCDDYDIREFVGGGSWQI